VRSVGSYHYVAGVELHVYGLVVQYSNRPQV
jgi:hypothetical protein